MFMNQTFKQYKLVWIIAPILGVIVFVCLLLYASGTVSLSMHGISVDHSGRLYVGEDHRIVVVDGGQIVGTITAKTAGAYMFTVQADDTILLSTSSKAYVMDLSGGILSEKDDADTRIYNQLKRHNNAVVSDSGEKYEMTCRFGRTRVVKGDEVLYEMPLLDYFVRITLVVLAIGLVCIVIYVLTIRLRTAAPR